MNRFSFRPRVCTIDGCSNASANPSIPVCLSGKRRYGCRSLKIKVFEQLVERIVRFLRGSRGHKLRFVRVRFSVKSDLLELVDPTMNRDLHELRCSRHPHLSLFYRCYVPSLHRVNDKTTRVYLDDRQECELFDMQIFSSTTQVCNSWTLEIKIQNEHGELITLIN